MDSVRILASNRLRDPDIQAVIFTARDLRFRKEIEAAILRANADTEAEVVKRTTELARINAELRIENQGRRQAEDRLQHTVSLLNATLDSTADGILVVSNEGKVTSCNKKFVEMWHLGCNSSVGKEDQHVLAEVIDQLQSPGDFIEKVRSLYTDPSATSFDVLYFKDGRIFSDTRNRNASTTGSWGGCGAFATLHGRETSKWSCGNRRRWRQWEDSRVALPTISIIC